MHGSSLPWLSLFILGAVHGINPAMGWLFAVARGLERRDRRALWRALGPLALGHAAAIAAVLVIALGMGQMVPLRWLRWGMAVALAAVGIDSLRRHRHVSMGGMQVSTRELAMWSFLSATAHGAGLMVLPFMLGATASLATALPHHEMVPLVAGVSPVNSLGVVAPLIHTAGYLAATALLAVVVYEWVGLRILRYAWINLNVLWSVALIVVAATTLLS